MRVGRLTSDVVLFSVAAFKTFDISHGSVATHLRCGGIFSDSIFSRFWQWNNFENRLIYGKVKAYKNGAIFWATLYIESVDTISPSISFSKLSVQTHSVSR